MSIGLLALLDDVALFAKVAAASLDDVTAQAAKAGAKAAAVVIDDAAVTPGYVIGFSAQRELPIIFKIALASLRNKLLILLPIAIALGYFAPWIIAPLLMFGAAYLCYEGAEKIFESLFPQLSIAHVEAIAPSSLTPEETEKKTIAGAVRTDFILSAEIMAIALSSVAESNVPSQIMVLALIGFVLTLGVYGVVALIVKMDDIGLAMAANKTKLPFLQKHTASFGRGLVLAMPKVLTLLTIVGIAAMTWVGGSIIIHGLATFGLDAPEHFVHHAAGWASSASPNFLAPLAGWVLSTFFQFVFGLVLGFLTIPIVHWAGKKYLNY